MVQLKVLILIIVGTISLSNKDRSHHQDNEQIMVCNIADTVILEKNEYSMKVNSIGFDLSILAKAKLKRINSMESPQVSLSIKGTRFIAVGINMFSSALPKNAEYFFPLNSDKKVWLKGNVLQFNRVTQ